ncbi:lipase family alpha/beta hydrolase [Streptomyces physcomitrii]|uniref:Alpha/beta fold hydrolase n=1 Tax=Streptomyces physcomitrii TaxID=2724184 RepID=A0ABX1GZM1_9ACTN|nr:alpha/beta fold hydrolase [Streptomyces physcomitrii]NKI40555.1 alpha/beta fold hydrolase [Streptomyces physcomitrii]
MQVTKALPLIPLCRKLLPDRLAGLSMTLLKASLLEAAILAGHLVLYPAGFTAERRPAAVLKKEGGEQEPTPLPADSRPPVVLLHGFIDNRSVFVLLRRWLNRDGRHHVESLNYSPLTFDVRAAADLLGKHIEEICARTGHREVDVVGHSLGGLIARYYVQRLGGDARVRTLVTLGTPHGGTRIVPLMDAHPIVRQMRPGSDLIEELRLPAPHCRTRFFSFWSELDQIMVPLETARITHPDLIAQNVRVSGVGHLALPVHPAVATRMREILSSVEDTAGKAGLTVA